MNSIRVLSHTAFCSLRKPSNRILSKSTSRFSTNITPEAKRQHALFIEEEKRQREAVGRIEKIEVVYENISNFYDPSDKTTLIMNKGISTPFDCAKHLGEMHTKRSALALLNGETLWHMHKPLPDSCRLHLLHYNIAQPATVNKAYWRTCSFLLGAVVSDAFKDNVEVQLHSFPSANVRSGSFVYDVQLSLEDWKPTQSELQVLSIEMIKFCQQAHDIRCLDVTIELALEIFKNNPHKTKQIPDIAAQNGGKVTLYNAGCHVDISRGPMVTNTNHLGRITVANAIKLNTDIEGGPIYRFQGVSLPSSIVLNHFAYGLLEERAKKLNPARIPGSQSTITEDNSFVAHSVA